MENQEYLVDDCKKDKELFNSYLRALILPIIFLIFIVVVFYVAQEERKEIYNAFINGEEIICDNFIVSKKLGFKFDKNNKYRFMISINSVHKIDYVNIGLLILSCILAFLMPFELFLFAYGVLGPLHYLTEISWLHDKNYYSTSKKDVILLLVISLILTIIFLLQKHNLLIYL